MAKIEDRPFDAGVAQARTKTDAELIEWWKQRVALLAGIPSDVARAGAVLPQLRELARLPEPDRRRLIKSRMQAVIAAPRDQAAKLFAAVGLANAMDPALVKSDQQIADQLAPEIPGAAEFRPEFIERREQP